MANVGLGALEIRGGNIIGENIQEVYQRVYEPDGSFNDRVAGTFTYHPEHKHIHFDGFAEFRLREVLPDGGVGAIVAGGLKTSFCIIDIENYDSDLAGQVSHLQAGARPVARLGRPVRQRLARPVDQHHGNSERPVLARNGRRSGRPYRRVGRNQQRWRGF